MLAAAGLDFVFIDTEHIPLNRSTVAWMTQAFGALGLPPIVRIPACDAAVACGALDAGARGIVAPYTESMHELETLRRAVKYRPLKGARLDAHLDGSAPLDPETLAYLENFNRNNVLLANVESVYAMDRLDDLLAAPDLDGVLVGPHDLSVSLGVPEQYTHPRFTDAMRRIIESTRARGLGVGYHFSFGRDIALQWMAWGANLIVHSTDYFLVRDAVRADLAVFHEAAGIARGGPERDEDVVV